MKKLAVMGLVAVFVFSGFILTVPSSVSAASDGTQFVAYNGTFTTVNSLSEQGSSVLAFSTEWGQIGLTETNGYTIFTNLHYGAVNITAAGLTFSDHYCTYTFLNDSIQATRPFRYEWTDWAVIQDTDDSMVVQRYAEGAHIWSGSTAEWNATVRVMVLKYDPYVRVDTWIRNLNLSSEIKQFKFNAMNPGGGTTGVSNQYYLSYQYGSGWAIGMLSHNAMTGYPRSDSGQSYYQMMQNSSDVAFHASQWLIVGSSVSDLTAKCLLVGDSWNTHEDVDDLDVIIAKNGDYIDRAGYAPSTGYTIYPSGTTATIYANGESDILAVTANPVLNYQKVPYIHSIDDFWFQPGENTTMDWIVATARTYGIATTWAATFHESDDIQYNYFANISAENTGTLFEISDHNYNHTSLWENPTTEYAEDLYNISQAIWATYSDNPLNSVLLAYHKYGGGSWEGMVDAGVKNLRLDVEQSESQAPYDYDDALFIVPYTSTPPYRTSNYDYLQIEGKMLGYTHYMGHTTNYYGTSFKASAVAFYSWAQNQTNILSSTFSQYSDLWHHRIVYDDNAGTIDLTSCQSNHVIYLNATDGADLWMDVDTGEIVEPMVIGSDEAYAIMEMGHTYQKLPISIGVSGSSITVTNITTSDDPIYAWGVNDTTIAMEVVITGLSADFGYKVYQDGYVITTGTGPSFSFTATGGGEFEVVVWNTKTVSTLVVLTINMIGLGIMVSVVVGWVLPFSRDIAKGRFRSTDQMVKELIHGVVFIVVGCFMYVMLYQVAIG